MPEKPAKRPAKKAAKNVAEMPVPVVTTDEGQTHDRGEDTFLMEPMLISEECDQRRELTDLVLELTKRSSAFRASLARGLEQPLAEFVRSMNCYYSNLIEGRGTHPVDIERALHNDLSKDPDKRDLQLEAKAHIEVQRWIDEGQLDGGAEMTVDGVCEIHRRFTKLVPESARLVEDRTTGRKKHVIPGALRTYDVAVGAHVPVSPGAIPRFMRRYEERYARLGNFEAILAAGPAHHRLVYIHPFGDGNGRVARLASYATLRRTLDTAGLWSVARGLARRKQEYMGHLASCDIIRRGSRDGRGHLGEAALSAFTKFFLEVCIDQVSFMEQLMKPTVFHERLSKWAKDEVGLGTIPQRGPQVLDAILYRGALPRADVAGVIGQSERTANNVMLALAKHGIVFSPGARAPWQIAFPAKLAPRLMPGMFPERS